MITAKTAIPPTIARTIQSTVFDEPVVTVLKWTSYRYSKRKKTYAAVDRAVADALAFAAIVWD